MEALPEATTAHVCPECGEEFKLAMHLGGHRKREHGVAGTAPKKKRRTTERESSPKARRKQAIASTLRELAELSDDARGRTTHTLPEHLSDVIRRDADKIATTIATVAEKVNPVAWFVDTTMGPTGLLTLAVGLSGVGRWLLRFWRGRVHEEPFPEYTPEQLAEMEAQSFEPVETDLEFP